MSVPVYDGAVKKLQFQSGADADKTATLDSYGVVGEPLWTTDTKKLWLHDGTSYILVGPQDADEVPFDNTASGMTATDVQAALDELDGRVTALEP